MHRIRWEYCESRWRLTQYPGSCVAEFSSLYKFLNLVRVCLFCSLMCFSASHVQDELIIALLMWFSCGDFAVKIVICCTQRRPSLHFHLISESLNNYGVKLQVQCSFANVARYELLLVWCIGSNPVFYMYASLGLCCPGLLQPSQHYLLNMLASATERWNFGLATASPPIHSLLYSRWFVWMIQNLK